MPGHSLSCQRCGRPFISRRSDARYCSRSCRRRPPVGSALPTTTDELGGWRRVPGGYVIPPADPRLTFRVD